MYIFLDLIKFIEASIMTSASLFCLYIFFRTRDVQIGRIIFVVLPASILMVISFAYSYIGNFIDSYYPNQGVRILGNVAPLLNIITIFMIGLTQMGIFFYFLSLIDVEKRKMRIITLFMAPVFVGFIIFGIYFVTVISKDYFTYASNRTNWIFFAFASLVAFLCALYLLIRWKILKNIKIGILHKYFIISFIPQIIYSALDLIVLKTYTFQFTNIPYLMFSLFSFYYISSKYFHSYELENPKESVKNIDVIKEKFELSNREMDLIPLLIEGKSNDDISQELYISVNTVKTHVKNIYKKADVTNRVQLIHKLTNHPKG